MVQPPFASETPPVDQAPPERCEFRSEGQLCRGWFYAPPGGGPWPCVVLAHGFGAAPNGPLGHLACRLQRAGIAACAFDFRHFGESEAEPRQLVTIDRQLADWDAAVGYVRAREDVEASRVGIWGSSLSGGHVLAIAARHPELGAAVAQVPYADGRSLARAAGLRHHLKAAPAIVLDVMRAAVGAQPHLISGLSSTGGPAAIDTHSPALLHAMRSTAPSWRNEIAARSLLSIYRFRPIREAANIRVPLLVVLAYTDDVAPSDVAMRVADGLPYVELALFRARHFDLYAGEVFERATRTEVNFLVHHLIPAPTPEPLAWAQAGPD